MVENEGVNVLVFVRDGNRYIFLWSDENMAEILSKICDYSANEELYFDWRDAALCSTRAVELING